MNHTQETPICYMGRTGSDNENANLICWLASEESSYVCGENIQIDGCRKKL
jgi:NAD(P)-dependent dehydrogenase (short-subunit alcohol dehydrogenase family)